MMKDNKSMLAVILHHCCSSLLPVHEPNALGVLLQAHQPQLVWHVLALRSLADGRQPNKPDTES